MLADLLKSVDPDRLEAGELSEDELEIVRRIFTFCMWRAFFSVTSDQNLTDDDLDAAGKTISDWCDAALTDSRTFH